jgi:nitroreductase
MELSEAIKTRRSIRVFKDQKVDKETVEKIVEAGTNAPSNCNTQGWRFIIVDDQKIKDKIYENGGTVLIKKAPMGILATYDNRTKNLEYKDYIQSAAAAMQNMFLTATSLGIGMCWLNHLPAKRRLRKILNIPRHYSPIGYFIMGYPINNPAPVQRKYTLDKIMSYNSFGENMAVEKISATKLLLQRIFTKVYHWTPLFIKKSFLNKFLDKHFVKKFEN